MKKIEPLTDHQIYGKSWMDENGNWQHDIIGVEPPSIREVAEKINEIIDYINKH